MPAAYLKFYFNVYFWDREREKEREIISEGKSEREGDRIWSRLQALSCQSSVLTAQSLTRGLNSRIVRSWPELSWMLNQLSHPGAPKFVLFFYVYLFLRERETERQSMSWGGAEREGDTESEAGSRLWVVSTEPDMGLDTNYEITTWAEVRHLTDWATQVPLNDVFKCLFIYFEKEREYMCVHARGWGRERKSMSRGEAERARERTPSRLCTVSLESDAGLEPTNCEIMTWAKIKIQTFNQLSHPGAPAFYFLNVPTKNIKNYTYSPNYISAAKYWSGSGVSKW